MDLLLLWRLPVLHGLPGRRALLPELQIHHQAASTSQIPGEQGPLGGRGLRDPQLFASPGNLETWLAAPGVD